MDERILWVHIEKSHVDDALAERNTTYLANLILPPNICPQRSERTSPMSFSAC